MDLSLSIIGALYQQANLFSLECVFTGGFTWKGVSTWLLLLDSITRPRAEKVCVYHAEAEVDMWKQKITVGVVSERCGWADCINVITNMLLFPHKLLQSVLVKICDNIPIRARALKRNRACSGLNEGGIYAKHKSKHIWPHNGRGKQKQMHFIGLRQELPFHTDLMPVPFYFVIGFIKIWLREDGPARAWWEVLTHCRISSPGGWGRTAAIRSGRRRWDCRSCGSWTCACFWDPVEKWKREESFTAGLMKEFMDSLMQPMCYRDDDDDDFCRSKPRNKKAFLHFRFHRPEVNRFLE